MKPLVRLVLILVLFGSAGRADVVLAPLFTAGAVLQRDMPHPVWGRAVPGEKVEVRFHGQFCATTADATGRWQVTLNPMPASAVPAIMEVKGANRLQVGDVLIGDVWLCSGQSNMEWAVSTAANPEQEAAAARYPLIRHCKVERTVGEIPADSVPAKWVACDPTTVLRFSAVGYFFARDQHQRQGIPVGIVTSAWGGTEVESWIAPAALQADPAFAPVFSRWKERLADYPGDKLRQDALIARWKEEFALAKKTGAPFSRRRPPEAEGPGSRWLPGGLYNGMIHPLVPFPFRGVLWYQGEANEFRAAEYARLFRTLIVQWRKDFGRDDLPFYFVQLANFATAKDPGQQSWAYLREAQGKALTLAHTGMVVTVDIGEERNIHYKNKQEVGRRLSLLVRADLQGERLENSGPVLLEAAIGQGVIRLRFAHADGLVLRGNGSMGFEVAGPDRKFLPGRASVEGDTLVVRADGIPVPVAVRYAWHNTPVVSLFNSAGLPASPFRTDNW